MMGMGIFLWIISPCSVKVTWNFSHTSHGDAMDMKHGDLPGGNEETRNGAFAALAAFLMWGLLPVYWKQLGNVNALEIIAHRGLWSLVCVLPLVIATGRMPEVRSALRGRNLLLLILSSTLLAFNWLIFVWAIPRGHILETSLGNFINPLFNMLCGVIFFRDRLTRPQWAALILVAAAVLFRAVSLGHFPWIALGLCTTFSFYGMVRKVVAVESVPGLMVENIIFAPAALAILLYLSGHGGLAFGKEAGVTTLLACAGFATSIPIGLFAYAARHLKLTTLGMFHYIVPSSSFILGVFVYREPFDARHLVTFAVIWLALGIYTVDKLRRHRLPARTENSGE